MNLPVPKNYEEAAIQATMIKHALNAGALDYDRAIELVKPRIDLMNERVAEIAKQFNRKPVKIPVLKFLRQ